MSLVAMITLLIKAIVAAFAVYGLSELITIEDGPFGLFRRPRNWLSGIEKLPFPFFKDLPVIVGVTDEPVVSEVSDTKTIMLWRAKRVEVENIFEIYSTSDEFLNSFKGSLYGLMSCGYCMGTWIALGISGLFVLAMPSTTAWPIVLLEAIVIFCGSLGGQRVLKARFDE